MLENVQSRSSHARRFILISALLALAVILMNSSGNAIASASITNAGFETGDFTGWTTVIPPGGTADVTTTFTGGIVGAPTGPASGEFFAQLKTNGPGSLTTASQTFTASAGDTISGFAFFADGDGCPPVIDLGDVRILSGAATVAVLFSADTCGDNSTPWVPWSHTFASAGTFEIVASVTNGFDDLFDSYLGLDGPKTKAELLGDSGVEGEGIDDAPGLDKPFNDKGKGGDNAGKSQPTFTLICHVQGKSGGTLMEVNDKALPKHLAHGDTIDLPDTAVGSDTEVEPNDAIADAQGVAVPDPATDACGRTGNASLEISGTGDGTFDYYSLDVEDGDAVVFETTSGNFDTELVLYDTAGNVLAFNDDVNFPVSLLSKITFVATADMTLVIGVGEFDTIESAGGMTGNPPDVGDEYVLDIQVN